MLQMMGVLSVLKNLTCETGLPNLQVFALTNEVDVDTASWVGIENSLGDFVAVIDPMVDEIAFLPEMLDKAVSGADVVFASNEQKPAKSLAYQCSYKAFNILCEYVLGDNLAQDSPQYRVLSKRVSNFIQQHPQPAMTYRHFPAKGGFVRVNLNYSAEPRGWRTTRLGDSIERRIRLQVSTTRAPLRIVNALSLFGAIANVIYSIYVVASSFLKADIAPGWTSLSLQQSGMFFLISLVLLVLGEYMLHVSSLSNEEPLYYVGQEFTSARMTRREKLNVEESGVAKVSSPAPASERVS
jgi:polyisoprenyl-phosphate glycosyltransferase